MTFSFMTKFAHEIPQKSAFGPFRKKVASQILKHILTIVITFWKDNNNATKMHFISIPSH